MDVRERTQELVHVEFDVVHRHRLLEFRVVSRCAVNRFGNVFEDEVQVDLILFGLQSAGEDTVRNSLSYQSCARKTTHLVAVRVEECAKVNDVRVFDNSHDLKFSILCA